MRPQLSWRLNASLGVLALFTISAIRPDPPLMVAAASDLQSALPSITARFEKETGHRVAVSYGSSGHLFTQIQHGAPFDVFLSADLEYARRLERGGRAVPGSLLEYASGRLALWARNDSGLDVRRGLTLLLDTKVRRIAIANPAHAPYGRAAVAVLQHERLYDQLRAKLVLGENISQAAQFVQSGNAEAGLIALALARAPIMAREGSHSEIPATLHPPIEQAAIVVGRTRNPPLAERFVQALVAPESVQVLRSFGFADPPGR